MKESIYRKMMTQGGLLQLKKKKKKLLSEKIIKNVFEDHLKFKSNSLKEFLTTNNL
jgi:hypothetical protein